MSQLYKILFTISLIFSCMIVNAQLAVVNSQKVISSMPVFQKIDSLVNREREKYIDEFNKKQELTIKAKSLSDSLFKVDPRGVQTLKSIEASKIADKELVAFAEVANKKIIEYKQLLEQPYIDKIMSVIKQMAIARKLMQVVDQKALQLYYVNPSTDITEEVIKQIKIK